MMPTFDVFFRLPLEEQIVFFREDEATDTEVDVFLFEALQRSRNGVYPNDHLLALHLAALSNLNRSLPALMESAVRFGAWGGHCSVDMLRLAEAIATHPALDLEQLLGLDPEPLFTEVNATFASLNRHRHLAGWFYKPETLDELRVFHGVMVSLSPWMDKTSEGRKAAATYAGTFVDPTTGSVADRRKEFPPWHLSALLTHGLLNEEAIRAVSRSLQATLAMASYDIFVAIHGPVVVEMLVDAPQLLAWMRDRSAYQTPAAWPPLPPPLPTPEPEPPPKKRRAPRGRR